ncbi:MAG: histidine--tRNA ligase [Methylococcales symbiont of Iophon sp. n. MRB-2018]|nr:MAG: histidine--tRNA ligase [Methylococcales symbiont of Iophon sp. n. MRB-2018]KAF3980255.1 MAG: histidine--tRNA ligase [Methylococcales symbiont of Iophon sp. n. MRB-2018]
MAKNNQSVQAIRGMHDILPEQSPRWQYAESIIREVMSSYCYQEIRLPIVEKTELFKRSIGEVTDIVEKEMYTFDDRNSDSLTLRPEGTAGCLRACLEHGLLHNQVHRLWYYGPMFRHERPQKGRYRQFYQLGVETYGMPGPDIDAEIILLTDRMWKKFAIRDKLKLEINTLGSTEERLLYREKLLTYFKQHLPLLDEDSLSRLKTNPLRILDSKNKEMQSLIKDAPELMDSLGEDSRQHFQTLTDTLDQLGVSYEINTRLVRGLDYYAKTVFEWVTNDLGAQGTVCAGGRYDGLVEQLGGKANHAVGFAMGMERLLLLLEQLDSIAVENTVDVYMIRVGAAAEKEGLRLAEQIRNEVNGIKLQVNCAAGSFKSQFKKADKSGAAYAIVLAEDEMARAEVSIKPLRTNDEQINVSIEAAIQFLKELI